MRLKKEHPELVFLQPSRRNLSEFVFVDSIEIEDVIDDKICFDQENLSSKSTTSEDIEEDDIQMPVPKQNSPSVSELFSVAMYLKDQVAAFPSVLEAWPPTACDITDEVWERAVPSELFNFISWVVGANDDPFQSDVTPDMKRKLNSICQDIIYLSSKGTKRMPKHISLGMTVRHITGSAALIGLLNGFGHCTSSSMVLEHDTALAELQKRKGPVAIPSCIRSGVFTNLVWDNNDFGEETLSGKGTTHNTNGIIFQ